MARQLPIRAGSETVADDRRFLGAERFQLNWGSNAKDFQKSVVPIRPVKAIMGTGKRGRGSFRREVRAEAGLAPLLDFGQSLAEFGSHGVQAKLSEHQMARRILDLGDAQDRLGGTRRIAGLMAAAGD